MRQLRDFLAGSLVAAGGVVDETADGLDVLLPAEAASAFGLPEAVRVGLGAPGVSRSGFPPVDGRLGSALVERLVELRLAAPSLTMIALPPELPRALPGTLPVLLNAVAAGVEERPVSAARYLRAELRLVLEGDERRSVLNATCVRLVDGAVVSTPRLDAAYPIKSAPLSEGELRLCARSLRAFMRRETLNVMAGALDAVRRRAQRDLERLREYYASLDAEMAQASARARSADERARRERKRAALPEDLAARYAQLQRRLSPRLFGQLVAAVLVHTDVQPYVVRFRRRAREGTVELYRRAGDGTFEGPACAACCRATLQFYLCDERLHVLCRACGQPGRLDGARCRACWPQQPSPIVLSVGAHHG